MTDTPIEVVYGESSPPDQTPPEATTSPVVESTPSPVTETPKTELTEPEPISDYFVANYAARVFLMGTDRLSPRGKYKGIPEAYRVPVMEFAALMYEESDIGFAKMFGYINQAEYDQIFAYVNGGYTNG